MRRTPRGVRRRWLAGVLAAAAVLALGGATVALVTYEPEQLVNHIVCHAEASRDSDATVVGVDGRDPVELCADVWARDGAVAPHAAGTEVPPLAACVPDKGGSVSVFPGGPGTCSRLGLASVPSGYSAAAKRFAALQEDLATRIPHDTRCVPGPEARAIVRRALDEHGFAMWTIEAPSGPIDDLPCTGLSYDAVRNMVILVPEENLAD